MEFRFIENSMQKQWELLVSQNPVSGFMQSFAWSEFKKKTGWDVYKIGLFEDGKLNGGAMIFKFPFSETKNFLYIPQGPVLDFKAPDCAKKFHGLIAEIDHAADLEGPRLTTHLRIEPCMYEVPAFLERFRKAPYNLEPRDTLMVDLTQPESVILAQMKPKGRYNIKVAQKCGVSVQADFSAAATEEFLTLYRQTVERNKFEGKDDRYFQILIPHLLENNLGTVFFAYDGDKILATAIVVFFGKQATYFFGASGNTAREKMAPYLLHWEIMRYAKARGCVWYDFWGIAPPDADATHEWQGITQFKRKFGGKTLQYIGAYDFVYNEKLYGDFLKESGEV